MANTIQIKRGTTVPSSGMSAGEPLFKTDDARFYIATDATTANWVGAPILDEDDMSSDSALKLATQQSIKAYVDSQVGGIDTLAELTDTSITTPSGGQIIVYDGSNSFDNVSVSGDATLDSAGALTIAANAVEGSMLNNNAISGQTEMTGDLEDTDELMVSDAGTLKRADFSVVRDAVFNDVSGDATIAAGGALTIAAGAVDNAMLANDSVSFGGVSLDLGQSDATPAFDLSDATNYPTSSLSGTITNAQLAGSIANAKLANSSITVTDGSTSTATALGGTITFAGTSNEVEVSESSGTITIGLPDNVTIGGNLTVSGTTTTVSSTTITVNDVNVALAANNSANTSDIGIYGKYVDGTTKYKGIFSDASNSDVFTFFKGTGTEPAATVNTAASGYALAGIKCASIDGATIDGGTY